MTTTSFDIVVSGSVSSVSAYPLSQKAVDAGFKRDSVREEYSDHLRKSVRTFAEKHGLTVDWSKDW